MLSPGASSVPWADVINLDDIENIAANRAMMQSWSSISRILFEKDGRLKSE